MSPNPDIWKEHLQVSAVTDVGMRRTNNQDSYSVEFATDMDAWRRRGHVFLVADGMGAHAAGELASKLAADSVPHLYQKHPELSSPEALKRALIETNAEINRKGQANLEFNGMGTTCSCLAIIPQGAIVGHVGDSRVYRVRGNNIEQLTFDHSLLWEMRASGHAASSDAIPRNVITRSLGPYPEVKIDVEGPFPIEKGDTFLLCSDGLVGDMEDAELGVALASMPVNDAAQFLVDMANLRGGPDNTTVIVIRVTSDQLVTSRAGAEQITVGAKRRTSAILPMFWAVFMACALTGGLLAFLRNWPAAILFGGAAVFVLLAILWTQLGSESTGIVVGGQRRFGRGPYTRSTFSLTSAMLEKLSRIVDELKVANDDQRLGINFAQLEPILGQIKGLVAKNDLTNAYRLHAKLVSQLMRMIRGEHK